MKKLLGVGGFILLAGMTQAEASYSLAVQKGPIVCETKSGIVGQVSADRKLITVTANVGKASATQIKILGSETDGSTFVIYQTAIGDLRLDNQGDAVVFAPDDQIEVSCK